MYENDLVQLRAALEKLEIDQTLWLYNRRLRVRCYAIMGVPPGIRRRRYSRPVPIPLYAVIEHDAYGRGSPGQHPPVATVREACDQIAQITVEWKESLYEPAPI